MRWLRLVGSLALASTYSLGAVYFYGEERWAQSSAAPALSTPTHPEGLMASVREAFAANDFSDPVAETIRRSLAQAPASYQPPFLLAVFHGSRLEDPERTERAFEAAVNRYPANGRMRLEYARWLFGAPREHASDRAEAQLKEALRLEPDLTDLGLRLLRDRGIPWDHWTALLPATSGAREAMVYALVDSGRVEDGVSLLKGWMASPEARPFYAQGARLALRWGAPALAVEIADRWQAAESEGASLSAKPFEAGLVKAGAQLELAEFDAAYRTFRETLKRTENRFGAGSVPSLELLCSMGYEYLNRDQAVLAQSLFGEAEALGPRYAPAALGLARALKRKGDTASAILHYQRALELDPRNEDARTELEPLLLKRP